jgi:hypothetical protein
MVGDILMDTGIMVASILPISLMSTHVVAQELVGNRKLLTAAAIAVATTR